MDRRDFITRILQMIIAAIFGRFAPQLSAPALKKVEEVVERALFKGGELKISMMIKGFEVDDDWANMIRSNPEVQKIMNEECGITVKPIT